MHKDDLEDLLDVLIEKGVSDFECPEFKVRFGNAPVSEKQHTIDDAIAEAKREAAMPRAARGMFADPRLWGPSGPPTFPSPERNEVPTIPTHPDEEV